MTSTYYETFLGIETQSIEGDTPLCTFVPRDNALGREEVMHGGAVASLLEAAAFAAVDQALAQRASEGSGAMDWEHITTTVDYLRPGLAIQTYAQARFEKLAGRSASLAVEAWNKDRSKLVATAEMTFIFRKSEG